MNRSTFTIRWFLLLAILGPLLLASGAGATIPEICGNGIDDGSSSGTHGSCGAGYANALYDASGTADTGCDLLCPEYDKDNDGYTSALSGGGSSCIAGLRGSTLCDPDDTNKWIYPGVVVSGGCTAPDYKVAPGDGTTVAATSCTTGPYCPATGSGACYYVSQSGNDSTGDGSYGNPWKSLGKAGGGGSAGSPPSGAHTLVAGDAIVILGTSNLTTQYSQGSFNVFLQVSQSGTSSNPILIVRDPHSTAKLSTSGGGAGINCASNVDYYTLNDISITIGDVSTAATRPIALNSGCDDWTINRGFIYDSSGDGDDNFAAVYSGGTKRTVVDSVIAHNILRSTGNVANTSIVNMINDSGTGNGVGNIVRHVTAWSDSFSSTSAPYAVFHKHGSEWSDVSPDGYQVYGNVFINTNCIQWEGSGLRWNRNRCIVDSGSTGARAVFINQGSSSAAHQENEITYSNFQNLSQVRWINAQFDGTEQLTFSHNILIDNVSSYTGDTAIGIVNPDTGTSGNVAIAEANGYLSFDYNNYRNDATAPLYSYYPSSGAAGTGRSNLADWRTNSSQDANSAEGDCTLDSYHRCTVTATSSGWRLTSEESTTTTMPTLVISGGAAGRGYQPYFQ